MGQYYIYILSSVSRRLYTGVTNHLYWRVCEHKNKLVPGLTSRYTIDQLVYFEHAPDMQAAIARRKQIKRLSREEKTELIESQNPQWNNLSQEWSEDLPGSGI